MLMITGVMFFLISENHHLSAQPESNHTGNESTLSRPRSPTIFLKVEPPDPLVLETARSSGRRAESAVTFTCTWNISRTDLDLQDRNIYYYVEMKYKRNVGDHDYKIIVHRQKGQDPTYSAAGDLPFPIEESRPLVEDDQFGVAFAVSGFECSMVGVVKCEAAAYRTESGSTLLEKQRASSYIRGRTLPSGIEMRLFPNLTKPLYVNDSLLIICGGGVGAWNAEWVIDSRNEFEGNSSQWVVRHKNYTETTRQPRPRCLFSGAVKMKVKVGEAEDGLTFRCSVRGHENDSYALSPTLIIARDEVTGRPLRKEAAGTRTVNPCRDRLWMVFGLGAGGLVTVVATIESIWYMTLRMRYPAEITKKDSKKSSEKARQRWHMAHKAVTRNTSRERLENVGSAVLARLRDSSTRTKATLQVPQRSWKKRRRNRSRSRRKSDSSSSEEEEEKEAGRRSRSARKRHHRQHVKKTSPRPAPTSPPTRDDPQVDGSSKQQQQRRPRPRPRPRPERDQYALTPPGSGTVVHSGLQRGIGPGDFLAAGARHTFAESPSWSPAQSQTPSPVQPSREDRPHLLARRAEAAKGASSSLPSDAARAASKPPSSFFSGRSGRGDETSSGKKGVFSGLHEDRRGAGRQKRASTSFDSRRRHDATVKIPRERSTRPGETAEDGRRRGRDESGQRSDAGVAGTGAAKERPKVQRMPRVDIKVSSPTGEDITPDESFD